MPLHTETGRLIGDILEGYAARGLLHSFSRGVRHGNQTVFTFVWHYDQLFTLRFDGSKAALRIATVLPQLSAKSALYRDFKRFLESRGDAGLPDHRRIDPARARVKSSNRAGNVALTMKILDGDYEYGTRKLIHLLNEIYLQFLHDDGRYLDWLTATFQLELDGP